ncbi:hypothetical protein ACISRA_04950, partial [Campylobacter jejuni]
LRQKSVQGKSGKLNLEKILNAKNLEELLNILTALNEDKMIKVYEDSYLKEKFPNVMVDKFLK